MCVCRRALQATRSGGAAIVSGRGRSLTVGVGPRCRSTRLVGCRLRSSTGAAGYAWWWGGHGTWALVDSGAGAYLTFNRAGGLVVVHSHLSSMLVLVGVVVVVEKRHAMSQRVTLALC